MFLELEVRLTPADTDNRVDVYELSDGQARLVSPGTPTEAHFPYFRGSSVSADGSHVVFDTTSALVPEDTDTLRDDYLWHEGTITLASTGPGDTGTYPITEETAMSRDGRIVFQTQEPLV